MLHEEKIQEKHKTIVKCLRRAQKGNIVQYLNVLKG